MILNENLQTHLHNLQNYTLPPSIKATLIQTVTLSSEISSENPLQRSKAQQSLCQIFNEID